MLKLNLKQDTLKDTKEGGAPSTQVVQSDNGKKRKLQNISDQIPWYGK